MATAHETVVMKFGGSSVADPESLRSVAGRLVEARERGARVVGTVSALGRTTASLLDLARRVSPDPDPRELDMLLSTGERVACALVAMAVHDLGQEAVSYTGSQAGILTDATYTKARIREITPVRVLRALDDGNIVLVAGFQGFSRDTMDVTTLGRGGTDATAVALAAALSGTCEIYTDAPGVFTADPRIVPGARKLDRVSYDEMLELAVSGAAALESRALEIARSHSVPLHARSLLSDEAGTWITDPEEGAPAVTAVALEPSEVVFTLTGVPGSPGPISDLFAAIAGEHVSVGTILQHATHGSAELSFTVPDEDAAAARRAVEATLDVLPPTRVVENRALGKVSVIGAGMGSQPGVAARMFRALATEHIDVEVVSTSRISISCMIARTDAERAVRALHDAFELDRVAQVS